MTAWYRAGTLTATNGSTTVAGSLTAWLNQAKVGDTFFIDDKSYEITAVSSNTSMEIFPAYAGATGSGKSYAIARGPLWNSTSVLAVAIADTAEAFQRGFAMRSTSAVEIGAGTKTFAVPAGLPILPGASLIASATANPTTQWMAGRVTDYVGQTLTLAVAAGDFGGAGTVSDWAINIAGVRGAGGLAGWSPVLGVAADGVRRVLSISGWTGGAGNPPPSPKFVGPTGLVDAIGDGSDIRGAPGDVTGPAANAANNLALWNGANSKILKDGGPISAQGLSLVAAADRAAARSILVYREVLTVDRTYYVRTDGSNSNDGLTNTAGGAFASLQKAIDTALKLDFNGCTLTIQLADGAYTAGGVIGPGVGITAISRFVIQGNAASPGNVIVSTPSGSVISAVSGGIVTLKDMELRGGHYCIEAGNGGQVTFRNLRFGAASVMHMYASRGGKIATSGNYSIVGSALYHIFIEMQGSISAGGMTVTLTGTPNFSYFAYCSSNSIFDAWGMSFIGGATGGRYDVSLGGGIYVGGGGANYFPGDVAGSVTSPGWYV